MLSLQKNFTLLAIFLCAHFASANEVVDCHEHLEFFLDLRDWKQAYKNSNDFGAIVEFTLKNETVHNWSELVTVQKLPPIEGTVDQYYRIFMDNLKSTVSPNQAYSRIIKKGDDYLFFEWWISHGIFAQHEWFKLIKSPCFTWILRYTTKNLDQVEKIRDQWEKIVDSAEVVFQ